MRCGRRRGALAHHQDHAELAERRLQHEHVGVERDDVADRRLAVDGEVAAVEQHDAPGRGGAGSRSAGATCARMSASLTLAHCDRLRRAR